MRRPTLMAAPILLMFLSACGDTAPASPSASAKPTASSAPKTTATAVATATASAAPSASASAAPISEVSVIGGADWKAVFAGTAPTALGEAWLGEVYKVGDPSKLWKQGAITGGTIYWAPSKKAVAIDNVNSATDADTKSVDTWIKSGLVSDVKHTSGPEVIEVGPHKATAKAGAGTCKMKTGEEADFYWWDLHSVGESTHTLKIVVIAKDAPEEDKKIGLSVLRQIEPTKKAKPHYKLP